MLSHLLEVESLDFH